MDDEYENDATASLEEEGRIVKTEQMYVAADSPAEAGQASLWEDYGAALEYAQENRLSTIFPVTVLLSYTVDPSQSIAVEGAE